MAISRQQRLAITVAIIAAEARAGAHAHALLKQSMSRSAIDGAYRALRREMDVLAALRVHACALDDGDRRGSDE